MPPRLSSFLCRRPTGPLVLRETLQWCSSLSSPDAGPEVVSGSLTVPDGRTQELDTAPFIGGLFLLVGLPNEESWTTNFPPGIYTLRFTQAGQPERVFPMDLPTDTVPVPRVLNHTQAQSINPGEDFTLHWSAFVGAGTGDYLTLSVEDEFDGEVVFRAPDYCVPIELPVTATSVVIPANTLSMDRTYMGTLTFGKPGYFSTNDVADMAGSSTVSKITTFPLITGSGGSVGPAPASLDAAPVEGGIELTLTGTPARVYSVQRTGTLASPDWVNVGDVTMDGSGQGVLEAPITAGSSAGFYRAIGN